MQSFTWPMLAVSTLICAAAAAADTQDDKAPPLGDFFGFQPMEVIKIGDNAGPVLTADINGDGLNDLVIVNNHASRIELHLQKDDASPDDTVAPTRVNEFPELWRYNRENVSVTHRVSGIVAHDFDDDGLLDLAYAGQPGELVFLRQTEQGRFEVSRRHRVRRLAATRGALTLANVLGDQQPELVSLVDGEIHIWPLDGDNPGQPLRLSAGDDITAFAVEDFNGNGRMDVVGMIPENAAPIRMWLATEDSRERALGPQQRFNMPALRAMRPVRLPNHAAARLAVLERASRRLLTYELATEELEDSGNREAAYEVHSFTDAGSRKRDLAVVDLDGDDMLDVITTDVRANAVVVYRQQMNKGLANPQQHPSLSELDYLAAAHTGEDGSTEIFVLSEREGVVGRSSVDGGEIAFPSPLRISDGYTPVAMSIVKLGDQNHVAVVARESRDYIIDLLNIATGERESVEIGSLSRSPETIVALDADHDGDTDLLVFTPDRPMVMLQNFEDGFDLLESRDMGQFGLVQAAGAQNTATFDINGDGNDELLLADRNYVRALRYNPEPEDGVSPGWQVVRQINASDSAAELVALTLLNGRIVAADQANNSLLIMDRTDRTSWEEVEVLSIRGFSFDEVHAGAFTGDGQDNILAVGSDGFAVIRLAGKRISLRETDAWRSSEERQLHHELATGDVNDDGFTDLIALDAGEQMADVFTFTESGRMLHATAFQIYESNIFSGGQSREYQPNQAVIADITGNGANDLIFVSHDRVMIYPQMTAEQRTQR